jgi:hypothetical protein
MRIGTVVGSRVFYNLFLIVSIVVAAAASEGCSEEEPPECSGDLREYKGQCMSNMAIEYTSCVEGRGFSTTTGGEVGVGGTFKIIANASVDAAYKKTQEEDTPVALEIVKACLEIAKNTAASQPERDTAADLITVADEKQREWQDDWETRTIEETPTLTLSTDTAKVGEVVVVSGTHFRGNEMVDISVHASLVTQVQADGNGAFSTEITIPSDAPPPGFSTAIIATGHTSARSARAPFSTSE